MYSLSLLQPQNWSEYEVFHNRVNKGEFVVTSIRRVLPERLGSIGFTFLSLLWLLIPIACRLFGSGRVRMEDTINFSAFKLGECESFLSWNSLNRKLGSNLMRKTCKTFFFFFLSPHLFFFFLQTIFIMNTFRNVRNFEL